MFTVKAILRSSLSNARLVSRGYRWRVVEEKFDGTEVEYGVFCLKVKADLVAQLLNETALVEAV